MAEWHVWTITQQRHSRVEEFLDSLAEVNEYFYPTVLREYNTKAGKRTRGVALFGNYIFINYTHNDQLSAKISSNTWIKDYVGTCSQKEMEAVLVLSKKKYEDLVPTSEVQIGRSYKLVGTPFVDMTCTVVEIDGDRLVVSVDLFGSGRLIKCSINDIDLER